MRWESRSRAAGLLGGRGIQLRHSDPMLLDNVAADFPGLTRVMARPSVPWVDEAISIATHQADVYIDLSGRWPTYLPPGVAPRERITGSVPL